MRKLKIACDPRWRRVTGLQWSVAWAGWSAKWSYSSEIHCRSASGLGRGGYKRRIEW